MYRGSTPEIKINLPEKVDLSEMKEIWVTVKNFYTTITKKLSEGDVIVDAEHNNVKIGLNQEETLSLSPGQAKVQVRFLTNGEQSFPTNEMVMTVKDILEGGVIS